MDESKVDLNLFRDSTGIFLEVHAITFFSKFKVERLGNEYIFNNSENEKIEVEQTEDYLDIKIYETDTVHHFKIDNDFMNKEYGDLIKNRSTRVRVRLYQPPF